MRRIISTTLRPLYWLYRELGGLRDCYGRAWKFSPAPELDPRTVQPVASRCTDYAKTGGFISKWAAEEVACPLLSVSVCRHEQLQCVGRGCCSCYHRRCQCHKSVVSRRKCRPADVPTSNHLSNSSSKTSLVSLVVSRFSANNRS